MRIKEADPATIDGRLSADRHLALLAEAEEGVLGHAVADRQRPVSHLFTGLFIGDDAVRAALVAALAQRQAAAGVRRLRVAVPDPSAAAFYTHLGFRGVAHLVRYERPAQPPRSPGAGASGLRPFVPGDAAAVTVHRLVVGHARDLLAPGGMLAMHVRPQRADELAAVVQAAGFRVETVPGSEAVYPTTVIGTMGAA